MHIVHIIVGLNVGGAELMLKRLVASDSPQSYCKHTVISLTSFGTLGSIIRAHGIDVYALGFSAGPSAAFGFFRLVALLRQLAPDITQTWMYHSDLIGGIAARFSGCKRIIWGVRTTNLSRGGSRLTPLIRWMCARLSAWLPHTIVCAAEASRLSHIGYGYCAGRMIVIPNGFDMKGLQATDFERASLRQHCGWGVDVEVVGCLARFSPDKDLENFVQAASLVAEQFPSARFLMVGRNLDENNEILSGWIARTGVAERFVLLGERSDVAVCLSAMDVFALSSRTEGFPNVVGEAMAMNLPCVVTDVGDASLLLGNCGVVVRKEEPAALAEGMTQLLSLNSDKRRTLGIAARDRIQLEFSMARCIQRFETLYYDAMKKEGHQ